MTDHDATVTQVTTLLELGAHGLSNLEHWLTGHDIVVVDTVALWLTTEGCGTIPYACGPAETAVNVGKRFLDAKVCSAYQVTSCCQGDDVACCFDVFEGIEHRDQQLLLTLALARADGEDPGQPWRCPTHGTLTYGDCCAG